MKQMKKDVNALTKELKTLTKKTEKIVKALGKLEKAQAKSKTVKKAVRPKKVVKKPAVKKISKKPTKNKASKGSVTGAIMGVIHANSGGVNTDQIMEQTGLSKRQVWGTINRAKKEGKVKTVKRGIYAVV